MGTIVRHARGRKDNPITRPVRFAYTYGGKTWLILEWDRQQEWMPLPAAHWVHDDDGDKLGEFVPLVLPDMLETDSAWAAAYLRANAIIKGES